MSKRIILIIIIIIFIVILGLAAYYGYIFYFAKPAVYTDINSTNTPLFFNVNTGQDNGNINSASNQPQVAVPKDDRTKIQSLAIIFGQNFGSYSNQTNLTNFDEIYSFMGSSMKKWIQDTYKAEIMKQHPQAVYYAIETKVLNVQITKIDEVKNTATAMLNTQRQEFVETPDNVKVFSQDLLFNLVKVNDNWIVDSAYWQ